MIYKIICNGEDWLSQIYTSDKNEIIIACDGGYDAICKLGLKCDYFFGDLDSLNYKGKIKGIKHISSPIKDETDLELALKFVINIYEENDEIIIYNATGGRLDHYTCVIRLLKIYKNYNIKIQDIKNKIYILKSNKEENIKEIEKTTYKYISFFNFEKNTIISLEGFKYDLCNYVMKDDDVLCVSNEIISKGVIKYNRNILVIESN